MKSLAKVGLAAGVVAGTGTALAAIEAGSGHNNQTVAEELTTIKTHLSDKEPFTWPVNVPDRSGYVVEVQDKTGRFIINPLVIKLGSKAVGYAGRLSLDTIYFIPSNEAIYSELELNAYNSPVPNGIMEARQPLGKVEDRTIQTTIEPDSIDGAIGFNDSEDNGYGIMP